MQPEQPRVTDRLIEWTGERCVPWTGDLQVVYEHYHRYLLARALVDGKRVLDLASGEGYGTALLAARACGVVGLEIDPATVAHSTRTYSEVDGLEFVEGSMLDLSRFPDGSFDVVTCFEALEHVAEHDELVAGVRRVLADDGVFLTSTPDRLVYAEELHQHNPHHVRELSLAEFRELLDAHFGHVRYWGQAVAVGSLIQPVDEDQPGGAGVLALERRGEDWVDRDGYAPTYYLAAASRVQLPELPRHSVLVDVDLELVRSAQRAEHDQSNLVRTRDGELLAARDDHRRDVEALTARLAELDAGEEAARVQLGELTSQVAEVTVQLEESRDDRIRDTTQLRATLDQLRIDLAQAIVERDLGLASARRAADDVASHQRALATIRNSRAHRATLAYYRMVESVAPAGTRRRGLYGTAGRGVVRVARRAQHPLRGSAVGLVPSLVLPTSERPTVSIVVPVHGKWSVTEQCLRSLAQHAGVTPFEVIVVDDASPDDTRLRLGSVAGVRVVELDKNLGFVGAVNAGIEASRGTYVVLLNNDTQVTTGWLEALVETGSQPDVGLVGSKLVYPDGRLQEAGGIIFDDASGWNYGKFDDPEREQYTYQRDVDYCSGAAILLRREVLAAVGNLDEYFAPAYYDDVDLAFAVREAGLRVVYEPRSVVVHHEGITHGTDEAVGIKAYQEVNRRKLRQKWAHRLTEQLPNEVDLVSAAARRRSGERIVVVIDHYVPRPDEDSGSVRMYGMLLTLRRLGYGVLFVPDNRDRGDVWGERLARAGIEVLYGDTPLETRFAELKEQIAAVIACRITMAWPYLLLVRRCLPGVPFVFDTIDLHHLREEREAELSGDQAGLVRAGATRELELALVRAADATIVVSPFEQKFLQAEVPDARIHMVPNVHTPHEVASGTTNRTGIVFLGSFAHPPNADGIRWFLLEVLPLIHLELPEVVVTIVGRSAPEDLIELAPKGVVFRGWVAELDDVYARARVAIAPLRYGAGIKGKVGEAMSFGVPVVGTSVAAEGMSIQHRVTGWVCDDGAAFAHGVVEAFRDDELWTAVSEAGRAHVERNLGGDVFEGHLKSVLASMTVAGLGRG
ncbi:glycosyltransferase [Pengzhenrongella sp.]|uniref:glycosyltransferase n=1 Tax=Pengzhenrongella sp. TaxID=2888820 RepID=UPI002F959D21